MKIWNRITAIVLCIVMLSSSVSAVELSSSANSSEEIQAQQAEGAEEMAEGSTDGDSSIDPIGNPEVLGNHSEDSGENLDGISALAEPRSPPLSNYSLLKCSGYALINNDIKPVTETFSTSTQGGFGQASFTTKYEYLPGELLTFTFYKYGNGTTGFDKGISYTISSTKPPYDYVYNSYGDAVGYKFDQEITVKDLSLSQLTLRSTARSRVTPYNTYIREVTVRFADNRSEPLTMPHFVLDPNDPNHYLLTGVNTSMEYRIGTELPWTACEGKTSPFRRQIRIRNIMCGIRRPKPRKGLN